MNRCSALPESRTHSILRCMNVKYSLDEVFEIAIKIEENGAAFYRRAAELQTDPEFVGVLKDLAGMEDDHKATFENMRKSANTEKTVDNAFDPYLESVTYLQSTADAHGGEGSVSLRASLTGDESLQDILRTAVGLEKDSIIFYLGIKDCVTGEDSLNKVDAIIAEEKSHLTTLATLQRKLA